MATGERVTISEHVATDVWHEIESNQTLSNIVEGQQQGIISAVSVTSPSGKSLPTVTWAAMNSTIDNQAIWPKIGGKNGVRFIDIAEVNRFGELPKIVVNQILADELSLVVDDNVELGYYFTRQLA